MTNFVALICHSTNHQKFGWNVKMNDKTYKARIKLSPSTQQNVTIQAKDAHTARLMLEAQFGKGSIVSCVR